MPFIARFNGLTPFMSSRGWHSTNAGSELYTLGMAPLLGCHRGKWRLEGWNHLVKNVIILVVTGILGGVPHPKYTTVKQ